MHNIFSATVNNGIYCQKRAVSTRERHYLCWSKEPVQHGRIGTEGVEDDDVPVGLRVRKLLNGLVPN